MSVDLEMFFLLQHHIKRYVNDECTRMIRIYYYEEYLIVTDNDVNKLVHVYKIAIARMYEELFFFEILQL